ncbi:GTP-binding protein Rho4p [Trichomonascus vanleenenianus]|uniref:GTP-binding protein Rho4p n=1 Tax=Trichomonascus vanleenenianus TaxID=2268995 RepID=UPI003ECAE1AD
MSVSSNHALHGPRPQPNKTSLRTASPPKRSSIIIHADKPPTPPPHASSLKVPKPRADARRVRGGFSDPIPVDPEEPETSSTSIVAAEADYHCKLVCIGDGNTGKTSLLVTYAHGQFPETYVPTVFENYLTKVKVPSGKLVELALWDTAGQEEYDRLRALSYPEADVLLVCFAIDAPASLDNVYEKWIPEVDHHCPDVPVILVGLKTDLRNDLTTQQLLRSRNQQPITAEQGKKAAHACGAYRYMECSARTGNGVPEVFNQAISMVIHDKPRRVSTRHHKPRPHHTSPGLKNNSPTLPTAPAASEPYRKRKKHRCIIL